MHLWDLSLSRIACKFTGQKQGRHVIRSCFGGVDGNFVASGSEGTSHDLGATTTNQANALARWQRVCVASRLGDTAWRSIRSRRRECEFCGLESEERTDVCVLFRRQDDTYLGSRHTRNVGSSGSFCRQGHDHDRRRWSGWKFEERKGERQGHIVITTFSSASHSLISITIPPSSPTCTAHFTSPPSSHETIALEVLQYVYNLQDLRTITLQLTPLYTYRHLPMGISNHSHIPRVRVARTRNRDSKR